jgi:toluene monooxygenase system ferredoxin subunit
MAFIKVCETGDVGARGMTAYYLENVGIEVLIVRDSDGEYHAYDGMCPHEDYPLVEGMFDGSVIICPAHGWVINARNGKGINPASCKISAYPIKIEGEEIHVDFDEELSA